MYQLNSKLNIFYTFYNNTNIKSYSSTAATAARATAASRLARSTAATAAATAASSRRSRARSWYNSRIRQQLNSKLNIFIGFVITVAENHTKDYHVIIGELSTN
ncbi:unnamed protein product [Rotaria sp. Silwood1]|nr:unnamed protein product [Rotaria sp. Silwood1]